MHVDHTVQHVWKLYIQQPSAVILTYSIGCFFTHPPEKPRVQIPLLLPQFATVDVVNVAKIINNRIWILTFYGGGSLKNPCRMESYMVIWQIYIKITRPFNHIQGAYFDWVPEKLRVQITLHCNIIAVNWAKN